MILKKIYWVHIGKYRVLCLPTKLDTVNLYIVKIILYTVDQNIIGAPKMQNIIDFILLCIIFGSSSMLFS